MSLPRKTVFWVIALVTLAGAFQLIDRKVEGIKKEEEASLRLFPFEPHDVKEFWIKGGDGGVRVKMGKEEEGWRLVEPQKARGDKEAIEKILGNIVKARKDAVLFTNPEPSKLEELGLDVPRLEMGLRTERGTWVILFGDQGPTHNVTYAMLKGDPDVYRIHSDVRKEADKDGHALRDKTILVFDPLKLRRLEIEREQKGTVVIEHDNGQWSMIEPDRARAAMSKVLETLYEIRNSEIKAFVDEKPSDLTKYGLGSPAIRVRIREKEDNGVHRLLIGERDRVRRGYFAKVDGSDGIFVIEESVVNSLLKNANEWKE